VNTEKATMTTQSNLQDGPKDRQIRVFVSSTFRDMIEERNDLMTHA
jgi:hypothetical protein